MRLLTTFSINIILISSILCCGSYESPESETARFQALQFFESYGYDLNQPSDKYLLPDVLSEISGLSYYRRNTLACVQDELGTIFLYDLKTKTISKRFKFGRNGDYEGLAVVNKSIFVTKSNGDLYRYIESKDSTQIIKTPLSSSNDVEGLVFDPQENRLLIACKESPDLNKKDDFKGKAIYSYYLDGQFAPTPAYLITHNLLTEWSDRSPSNIEITKKIKGFKPSGIAVHPKTGEIFVIAYAGRVLIVMSRRGTINRVVPLSPKRFKQPEGICFAPNGDMYISNESKDGVANIFRFDYKK